jgi:hypothetical protein
MKNEILIFEHARSLSQNILDILSSEGYNAEESLPALMIAAADLVVDTPLPSQALDEAINVLVEEYELHITTEPQFELDPDDDDTDE